MITINSLELENVKKVVAGRITPSANGLTIIGGPNGAGKTTFLDAICFALGGEKYKPSNLQRDESFANAYIKIELSNGLIVERTGKNASLKITDPTKAKQGQKLLDAFVEKLALDLPKFLNANAKEKANTLLKIIGVGEELKKFDAEEEKLYNERHTYGQITDQKEKFAAELPHYPDAPDQLVSATEMIKQQQAILAKNGENQQQRGKLEELKRACDSLVRTEKHLQMELIELQGKLNQVQQDKAQNTIDLENARKTVDQLNDESTEEIEKSLLNIEEINVKVRANFDKAKAIADATKSSELRGKLTDKIEEIRRKRMELLDGVDMPLDGLSVKEGELIYRDKAWDCMSSAEQLKVSTAIIRKLNPDCGFVLIDKLEQMDVKTLEEFGEWAKGEMLQLIGTRVSTGDECQIIIEEGMVVKGGEEIEKFSAGEF